jgi:predicted O-linked N-acetylglucosamine transferase (SPINDLY family)
LSFNQTKTYKELIDFIKINEFDKIKKILDNNKEQYQNDAGFLSFLGYFNQYLNNFLEAEKNYLKAIKLEDDNFDAKLNLAILYLKLKKLNESEILFNQLLKKENNYLVLYNFGLLNFEKKNYLEAIKSFKKSSNLNSEFFPSLYHLAITYEETENYNLAIEIYEKLIKSYNDASLNLGLVYNNLGNLYHNIKKLDLAYKFYLKSIHLLPERSKVYNNLGYLCFQKGDLEKSIFYFKKASEKDDKNLKYHSRFIASSLYSYNHQNLYINYVKHFNSVLEKFKINLNQNNLIFDIDNYKKKIRVGFLSADFKRHPVGYFLLDHLDNFKKFGLELFGYSNLEEKFSDDYTKKISIKFNFWNNIKFFSDEDLVLKIKNDKINILIDLSGHTGDNRIKIFKIRAAPIQINWAAYLASTGIKEMDYILGDRYVTPMSDQHKYSENIIQLEKIWCCLSVSDLKSLKLTTHTPAIKNKYITFGSFANANKINKKVLKTWLKILINIPNSKLLLKSFEFQINNQIDRIYSFFLRNNIYKDRIIIEKPSDRLELLNSYNNIDIVLDTFPYSGGTTSFEASWMCVPILTIKGNYFISKCGESINSNLNMKDWITNNIEDYVAKCILFSKDFEILDKIKNKLILNSRKSNLFNSEKFSEEFSKTLKFAWNRFICEKNNF